MRKICPLPQKESWHLRNSSFSKHVFHHLLHLAVTDHVSQFLLLFFTWRQAGSFTFSLAEDLLWFLPSGMYSVKSASLHWNISWRVISFKLVLMASAKDSHTPSASVRHTSEVCRLPNHLPGMQFCWEGLASSWGKGCCSF